MIEAMMQNIEETLARTIDLGFQAANSKIISLAFHFLEVALMILIHKRTLKGILKKSFDFLFHSDAFMDTPAEKVHGHSMQGQDPAEPTSCTTKTNIKEKAKKGDELITPMPSETVSSRDASDDSLMARDGPCCRKKIPKKSLLAVREGNWKIRGPLPHLPPFQRRRLCRLRRKATQNSTHEVVSWDSDIIPNVMAMAFRSFTKWTPASNGLSTTGCIDLEINWQGMITPLPTTSENCLNAWQHRQYHLLLTPSIQSWSLNFGVVWS